ncbi:hypothetical protein GF394_08260, partial [Candidatus Fermentibacteria bacterium]|nr:hypothetical protein [Candidatus Fermentibacteria bacterium]
MDAGTEVAREPLWAPDSRRLSYLDQDGRLHVMDTVTGHVIEVCDIPDIIHHAWSSDGRWLAFSVPVLAHREDVFAVSSRGGEPRNISMHPNDDFQPFWPSDGRRLLYASRTDEGDYSVKQVWLRRYDWDAETDVKDELIDSSVEEVTIDWDGIQRRTETLCTVEGYYDFYGASPDGRTIALPAWDSQGRMDLWRVDWKGENLSRLTHSGESPGEITVFNDGSIYYLSFSGSLRKTDASSGASGSLNWTMPVWRSVLSVQQQKFDEAWRLLRDNFYDPEMHDVNWDSVGSLYRERAVASVINSDFNDVVKRMLGELSASHLNISPGWTYDSSPSSGSIGVIPDTDWMGPGILVDSVIPFSPADLECSKIYSGDILLSIQGMEVGPEDNIFRALLQRRGLDTRLTLRRGGETITMNIEPVSIWSMNRLVYEAWVERNRTRVSRMTGDRVGYLHIPSMSNSSVDQFLVDLFAQGLNRDGMIIDIRNNGGGSTHDEILRRLERPMYM